MMVMLLPLTSALLSASVEATLQPQVGGVGATVGYNCGGVGGCAVNQSEADDPAFLQTVGLQASPAGQASRIGGADSGCTTSDDNCLKPVATIIFSRHGQRPPYPPPGGTSAASGLPLTNKTGFPGSADFGLSQEEFDKQALVPLGRTLLRNMGEYERFILPLGQVKYCDVNMLWIADNSSRDVQSASAFIDGFLPKACRKKMLKQLMIVGKGSLAEAVASDGVNQPTCPVIDEEQSMLLFGGRFHTLTNDFKREIDKVNSVLGCCTPEYCSSVGLPPNCSIAQTPYSYSGKYYQGQFTGPLNTAGYFAEAFAFQLVAGVPKDKVAFGELNPPDIEGLFKLTQALQDLGSNMNNSVARGSTTLAYILATFEQVVTGKRLLDSAGEPVLLQPATAPLLLGIFGHDFNEFYLRKLLGATYLTRSFNFDTAPTGSHMRFDLLKCERCKGASAEDDYVVRGTLVSASVHQMRNGSSFLPPQRPPGVSTFLRTPFRSFKQQVLRAIQVRCVAPPLDSAIQKMLKQTLRAAGGVFDFAVSR